MYSKRFKFYYHIIEEMNMKLTEEVERRQINDD